MVVDGVELRPDGDPVKINLDTYRALAAAGWEVTDDGRKPRVPELIVVENEDMEGIIREPNYELPEEAPEEPEASEEEMKDAVEAEVEAEGEAIAAKSMTEEAELVEAEQVEEAVEAAVEAEVDAEPVDAEPVDAEPVVEAAEAAESAARAAEEAEKDEGAVADE